MNEPFAKAEALFHEALELPPGERAAFLQSACGADAELHREVTALLRASGIAEDWLKEPSPEIIQPDAIAEGPGTVIGRYKLLEKIGEGGFGTVYLAEQEQPVRRRVAIKVIKLGMDTRQVVARFEAERQALALMDHPNIAKVLDAGATDAGRPYFVMELVRGIPITKFCEEQRLAAHERLELFIQVCSAIQHAHQKGIIHRDIKPNNVLVTRNDGVPHPMVIDFGVAKAIDQRLTEHTLFTQFAQIIGTPAYMSPEQAEMSKQDVDTRSDIYSLGVVLYELLTGAPPFSEERLRSAGYAEMQRIIREEEPEKPSTKATKIREAADGKVPPAESHIRNPKSEVDRDLDWIVMKCLEKDRTRRYETANDLGADLRRFLNNEPVVARPPSKTYRLQKLVRRNKLAVAAGGIILITGLAGLGATLSSLARERKARTQAEEKRAEAERAHLGEQHERFLAQSAVTRLEIERAEQLFDAGNSSTALAYLARILRHQPTNRVVAERILWALSHRNFSLPTLAFEHSGTVNAAGFSPDGTRVATASQDKTARVWDSISGAAVTPPLMHQGSVGALRFSFDGRKVLTGSDDQTARVWDANSGNPLTPPLQHSGAVVAVDFSGNGRFVATASEDGTARVWHAETGQPAVAPFVHSNSVRSVCFSPDGRWLLTGSGSFAYIWEIETGRVRTPLLSLGNTAHSAKFTADGTRILTASASGSAEVWEFKTGRKFRSFGLMRNVFSAEFGPEEERVAAGGNMSSVRIWDLVSGDPITSKIQHAGAVTCIRFSPDGKSVLTASKDNTARIWDAESGRPLSEPLWHNGSVEAAAFSPDGQRVLTVSEANSAFIWETRISQTLPCELPHPYGVAFARFSPDGRQAATVGSDKITRVWDSQTGKLLAKTVPHSGMHVTSLCYSSDGQRIITASHQGMARVWDANTAKEVIAPLRHWDADTFQTGKGVWSAAFSPDGTCIVTASSDSTARVWDASTGAQLLSLPHGGSVRTAVFDPEGRRILTGSKDGAARIWNTDGQLLRGITLGSPVNSAEFSRDGFSIVTASFDKSARRWNSRNGQPIGSPMLHNDEVASASFSPDGGKVVTRCGNAAYIWHLSNLGHSEPLALRHATVVRSAVFSPDGLRVLTASFDETARVWDAETGHPVSERIEHREPVNDAHFSPDGGWIIMAAGSDELDEHQAIILEIPMATLPVGPFLTDLAEAVAGQRFHSLTASQPIGPERLLQIRRLLGAGAATDPYHRWGQWFFSNRVARTISPSSTITTEEYLRRQIEKNTILSLENALLVSPTNATALGRLIRLRLKQDEPSWRLALAARQMRLASQAAPDDPELWAARAAVCEQLGGSEHELHEVYARFAEVSKNLDNTNPNSTPLLLMRARVLKKLDRLPEAAEANLAALGLPARDPDIPATLLDLSLLFNYTFALFETTPPLLQQRPQRLANVDYDLRGAIRLDCINRAYSHLSFPSQVSNLPVLQRGRALHFLHGVFARETEGVHVATYVIHYSDGKVAEIPLKYGEEVRTIGRVDRATDLKNRGAAIVWRGMTATDGEYRLFSLRWSNPRPDAEIRTIDIVSKMTASSPTLFAITVEQ